MLSFYIIIKCYDYILLLYVIIVCYYNMLLFYYINICYHCMLFTYAFILYIIKCYDYMILLHVIFVCYHCLYKDVFFLWNFIVILNYFVAKNYSPLICNIYYHAWPASLLKAVLTKPRSNDSRPAHSAKRTSVYYVRASLGSRLAFNVDYSGPTFHLPM